MKIIINLPKSATALASMMLSDSVKQEKIDAAIKWCEEHETEIDMADVAKQTGSDNSDLQALNMGLAIIALGKAIEDVDKNKEEKADVGLGCGTQCGDPANK